MNCSICKHGETEPGHVTVTLEREGTIVVIKNVPAQVCQDCSEYYLDQTTTDRVLEQAADAARRNAEMEVLRYAA